MSAQASASGTNVVFEEQTDDSSQNSVPILRLRLGSPGGGPRVVWASDVVDNEHLNRKKSKCCCIYVKHRRWDESSSESESETECDHCRGHVELKKKKPHPDDDSGHSSSDDDHGGKREHKKHDDESKDHGISDGSSEKN